MLPLAQTTWVLLHQGAGETPPPAPLHQAGVLLFDFQGKVVYLVMKIVPQEINSETKLGRLQGTSFCVEVEKGSVGNAIFAKFNAN